MAEQEVKEVARILRESLGNITRRLMQTKAAGGLSWRESSALSGLVRGGPRTSAELARLERISPQSMGATLKSLEDHGLILRSSDPEDRRRIVFEVTDAGRKVYRDRFDARSAQLERALAEEFTAAELELLVAAAPVLDKLAERIIADGTEQAWRHVRSDFDA